MHKKIFKITLAGILSLLAAQMNAKELQTPVVTSSKISKKPSVVKKAKPKKSSWRQHWKIITAVPINAIVIILLFFGIKRHYKEKLRMANPNQLRIENSDLKSQLQNATTKIEGLETGQAAENPSETDKEFIRLKAENGNLKSQLQDATTKIEGLETGQAVEKPSETDEEFIRLKAENNKLKSQLNIKVIDYIQQQVQAGGELNDKKLEEMNHEKLLSKAEELLLGFRIYKNELINAKKEIEKLKAKLEGQEEEESDSDSSVSSADKIIFPEDNVDKLVEEKEALQSENAKLKSQVQKLTNS